MINAVWQAPVAQGVVVGLIALFVGLLPIGGVAAPWRLLVTDSIVSVTAPVFGAKPVDWRRQRRAARDIVV